MAGGNSLSADFTLEFLIQAVEENKSHQTPLFPTDRRVPGFWINSKKEKYIRSLINGEHLGIITLKIGNDGGIEKCLDGKERLEAIWGFVNNQFPITDKEHNILWYFDSSKEVVVPLTKGPWGRRFLSEEERQTLLGLTISVLCVPSTTIISG